MRDEDCCASTTRNSGLSSTAYLISYGDEKAGRRIRLRKHRGIGQQTAHMGWRPRFGGEVFRRSNRNSGRGGVDSTPLSAAVRNRIRSSMADSYATVAILSGTSGVGKSTTATEFLASAAADGSSALAYLFDESIDTFSHRCETFGMPLSELRDEGTLLVRRSNRWRCRPRSSQTASRPSRGAWGRTRSYRRHRGLQDAIKRGQDDVELRRRLHALTQQLTRGNTAVVLIDQRRDVTGLHEPTSENVSYLADKSSSRTASRLGRTQRVVGALKRVTGSKPFRVGNERDYGSATSVSECTACWSASLNSMATATISRPPRTSDG
ncbi:hypothetical protein C8039_00675 [Halogeometricum sp. wsp3]|nr:hypothetical protein C8039_00675 [Halogeometricum sp. wsp3]